MTASFSERLRESAGADWRAATAHRFVAELADGSLAPECFRKYLTQDYAFIETLVTTVGFAVARADGMAAKKRLAGFLGVLTSDENDYFRRAFDAVGVGPEERSRPALSPVTAALRALMLEAGEAGTYADVLSAVVPAEWVYLTWGLARAEARPPQPHYREWIELHSTSAFADFVAWLRTELDRQAEALPAPARRRIEERFRRVVRLEVEFFDQAYA